MCRGQLVCTCPTLSDWHACKVPFSSLQPFQYSGVLIFQHLAWHAGPYIRTEIPLVIMFSALGIVADRDSLERIVSSRQDLLVAMSCSFTL